MNVAVVVPTIGRPSLRVLLDSLAAGTRLPEQVLLVDDRATPQGPLLPDGVPGSLGGRVRVIDGRGTGPAAARNAGWRAAGDVEWIAFLDDDVVAPEGWYDALLADLTHAAADVGAVMGHVVVPLPTDRRPTDWERNVAGLQDAEWATADMAYRRRVLVDVGGFDERFPRAYREDADLGLRTVESGRRITRGERHIVHPVRPADRWVSVRLQRGNADDVLMRMLHGPDWRERAHVPQGRRRKHLATTGALALALTGAAVRRPRAAAAGAAAYLGLVGDFAWRRIVPGPRTPGEVTTMLLTSAVIPPVATYHWLRGWVTIRDRLAAPGPVAGSPDLTEDEAVTVVPAGRGVELPA